MAVRRAITKLDGIYFVTITCIHWLHLFQISDGYFTVHRRFDNLKSNGHFIVAYVIMPNHLHIIMAVRNTHERSINSLIGNGKRFMAYELVRRLQAKKEKGILDQMGSFVTMKNRLKGQLHQVFEPSFDWKECYSDWFLNQKLNYIHRNPCAANWTLAVQPEDYLHSSAAFYSSGQQGIYEVMSYTELEDIDLTTC